ncbi:MAG: hypothetical protein ACFE0R_11545 [Salinarimonas sp.]
MGPRVVLDACVLLPPQQRNLLLQLAFEELFEACWTDRIIEEWLRNVDVAEDRVRCEHRTLPLMRRAFPKATLPAVGDAEIGTTDVKDRHVAQAALSVVPCTLLSWNLRDFDGSALRQLGVEVRSPDDFLCRLYDTNPALVVDITRRAMANLRRTAPSWSSYLVALERNNLHGFVGRLLAFERSGGSGQE